MKIEKTDYTICCDVPGCGKIADYCISFEGNNNKFFLCEKCVSQLKNELNSVGVVENAK